MYTSTRREYWEYNICMYACMYACIMYVCMYVRYSARRSLFGALIGALGDMDVLNMHVLLMYVYIDAPIVLGVLYRLY